MQNNELKSAVQQEVSQTRSYKGIFYAIFAVAVGLSIFQVWQILTARLGADIFRPVHLTWVMILVFLHYPLSGSLGKKVADPVFLRVLDILFALLSLVCGIIILSFDYDNLDYFINGLDFLHIITGIVFFLLLMEVTRRTVGVVMMVIGSVFVLYNLAGSLLPGSFAIKRFSLSEFLSFQVFSTNGMFGLPLGIAAGVVFVFVLFGALLEFTKAGDYYTQICFSLTGKYRGGPAKASVLASALLGSISGSAIANAVTTGTFTIPLMKKLGYKPEQAAGIEAAASTGGQIMPPIMGAGAFIMAQFTGIPYKQIVLVCFIPAILYFLSTLLYVHLMACKQGIDTIQDSETGGSKKAKQVLLRGVHLFIPIVLIFVFLLLGFTPALVGILGCGFVILTSFLRSYTRLGIKDFFRALRKGALLALPVSVACATAGVIVGVVGQTGLGLQFTNFILSVSSGYLFLVFALTALMALVLGMGLPVTASYILLSIVAAPIFVGLGVPLLTAHVIIFWVSQTSNVTPPIALAAFAAAGIAKSGPMRSAVQAFKLSSGLLLIPIMMLYSSLLYTSGTGFVQTLYAILLSLVAIFGLAVFNEGFFARKVNIVLRIVCVGSLGFLVFSQGIIRFIALIVIGLVLTFNAIPLRRTTSPSHT